MAYSEYDSKDPPEIKVDTFWLVCPKCGDYMNDPVFNPKDGKAYHRWCKDEINKKRRKDKLKMLAIILKGEFESQRATS